MKSLLYAVAILLTAFYFNAAFIHLGGWHFKVKPTPEQLYGCSFAEADAHNGECP